MRIVIAVVFVVVAGCTSDSKNEKGRMSCSPIFDKAVTKLQKFAFSLDTLELDSALIYYDNAIKCDTLKASKLEFGRYRESLTVVDNVYKVRDVPSSRLPHFWTIKARLFERLGNLDSAGYYRQKAKQGS